MKLKTVLACIAAGTLFMACKNEPKVETPVATEEKETVVKPTEEFDYVVGQFADLKILRYQIPGWENLSLKEQKLVYYLTQAGLSGRDIMWDQNYRHNLVIRHALEKVYTTYTGDKTSDDWKAFETYLKRVWFSNGIHHHYSNDKIKPEFSQDYLSSLLAATATELPKEVYEVIFNDKDAKKVNLAKGIDNVAASAVNFYGEGVTNKDVEEFYKTKKSPNPEKTIIIWIKTLN